jgi:hypothetical protein
MTEKTQSSCYLQPMKKRSHPWSPALFNHTKTSLSAYTKLDASSETKHDHDKVFYAVENSP